MTRREPKGLEPASQDGSRLPPLPVFAAAGLIDPQLVMHLLEREVESVRATLQDFRRVEMAEMDWAMLMPHPGGEVDGVVYIGLRPADLERLDAYRGVREGLYRRAAATARLERGGACAVFVYLPTERTLRRHGPA